MGIETGGESLGTARKDAPVYSNGWLVEIGRAHV